MLLETLIIFHLFICRPSWNCVSSTLEGRLATSLCTKQSVQRRYFSCFLQKGCNIPHVGYTIQFWTLSKFTVTWVWPKRLYRLVLVNRFSSYPGRNSRIIYQGLQHSVTVYKTLYIPVESIARTNVMKLRSVAALITRRLYTPCWEDICMKECHYLNTAGWFNELFVPIIVDRK